MAIKGIMFDKDGTLISVMEYWYKPLERTIFKIFDTLCIPDSKDLFRELMVSAGIDGDKIIQDSPLIAGTNFDIAVAMEKVLNNRGIETKNYFVHTVTSDVNYFACEYGQINGTTNLKRLFAKLKNRGIKIALATSDGYASSVNCLDQLGVEEAVDFWGSDDGRFKPKPNPDIAEKFCKEFGFTTSEIIMVGDSENDMLFAKNSGCIGVFVTDDLAYGEKMGFDYSVSSIDEVLEIIGKDAPINRHKQYEFA